MAFANHHRTMRNAYDGFSNAPYSSRNIFASPPAPISMEEIIRRRRNREDIRNLYECYRRIKFYTSQEDPRFATDIEQDYLSLISASKGCTSVQRIVVELLPRYASHCPTALEAAVKVAINMYQQNFAIILRGRDVDGIAFLTAKACVCGLVDMCTAAASVETNSSVISGICSTVFRSVLIFFISNLEDGNLYWANHMEVAKVQESAERFSNFMEKLAAAEGPPLSKLFMFRCLCLLRIFIFCPKNLLLACFEFVESTAMNLNAQKWVHYFLREIAKQHPSLEKPLQGDLIVNGRMLQNDNLACVRAENTLMGMVISRCPSLGDWLLKYYKKLCQSVSFPPASESSLYEVKFLESFEELVKRVSNQADQVRDDIASPKGFKQPKESADLSGVSLDTQVCSECKDKFRALSECKLQSQSAHCDLNKKHQCLITAAETAMEKVPLTTKSEDRLSSLTNVVASPKCHDHAECKAYSRDQNVWYSDGDSRAMDVVLASKQLLLGPFGSTASETVVKRQLENFGVLTVFIFCTHKGFALAEYSNIKDAIEARACLCDASRLGSSFEVKFLDSEFNIGSIHDTAEGDRCYVYIGNAREQSAKDYILDGLMNTGTKTWKIVAGRWAENAMVLQFRTLNEAHLGILNARNRRKDNGDIAYTSRDVNATCPNSLSPVDFRKSTISGSSNELACATQDEAYSSHVEGQSVQHSISFSGKSVISVSESIFSANRTACYESQPSQVLISIDQTNVGSRAISNSGMTHISDSFAGSLKQLSGTARSTTGYPSSQSLCVLSSSSPPTSTQLPLEITPANPAQWHGTLCKSGMYYCKIFASRENSASCKYTNGLSEPVEWQARLDMSKRSDILHVKTVFDGTPSNKKEVCRLLPSAPSDSQGFQEFISYLKRKDCAGVIKISAGTFPWSRLLFILPYSVGTCKMLSISVHPANCLIAFVVPKERNRAQDCS